MTGPTLTLRVSRRAIGVAILTDEKLAFFDGRHLTSRSDRAVPASMRYVQRLVELNRPERIIIDAPRTEGSSTDRIVSALRDMAVERATKLIVLGAGDLLTAFGLPALSSRIELRGVAEACFAELEQVRGKVKPYVVDAAAAALFADVGLALGTLTA